MNKQLKDHIAFFLLTLGFAGFTLLIAACFLVTDADITAFLGVK